MRKIFVVFLALVILTSFFFITKEVKAYGECDQYGYMAIYDSFSNSCKCTSGYVFGKDVLGQTACVSVDSICHDRLGIMSRYNILSDSCECSYGYVLGEDSIGRTQCVSENEACQNQYGYNARASYGGKCECGYGYVFNENNQCEYGNTVCHRKHGLYSSYDSLSSACKCDSGYTLDDSSQCVKKQNNVYFTLKELDADNKKAIIKSDYDNSYYLITYGVGCYSFSFERYLYHQIIVNLGTDFYLDTWDKIVLQDDDETCDITHREKVDSGTTLIPSEEEVITYFKPQKQIIVPSQSVSKTDTQVKKETKTPEKPSIEQKVVIPQINLINAEPVKKIPWYKRLFNWLFN